MNAMARRLELPRVPRARLAAINHFSTPRSTLQVAVSGLVFDIVDVPGPALPPDCRLVVAVVNGHTWQLRCDVALIRCLLVQLDPDLAGTELPGDDLAPLLLQLAAGPLPVEVMSVSRSAALAGARAVTVRAGEAAWPCELAGDFSSWPERLRPTAVALDLPMAVAIRIGVTRLEPGVLATLQEGDAVLIEQRFQAPGSALLVGAEAWVAEVMRLGHGWTLKGSPKAAAQDEKNWTMAGRDDDAVQAAGLPVTLSFDLGRIDMTVAEFVRLGAGSVLDLKGNIAEPVEIRANGRRVGQGEFVDIDGTLGVRIIRWRDAG